MHSRQKDQHKRRLGRGKAQCIWQTAAGLEGSVWKGSKVTRQKGCLEAGCGRCSFCR